MNWLDRLKKSAAPEMAPTKPTEGAFVGSVGTHPVPLEVCTPPSVGFVGSVLAPAEVCDTATGHAEPTTHCPVCGSPSWWLSPDGWCCAYCTPRPVPFLGASLVIAAAWADGRAPAPDEEPGHPAEPEPVRPDDGRVQDLAGAWRSPEHHAARDAFYVHHDACPTCRRACQRRGLGRCDVGRALYSAYTLAALADRGGRP